MTTFQVQLWPNGKWDGKDYQGVEAKTAKEAGVLGKSRSDRFIVNEPFHGRFENYASDLLELRRKLKEKLQEILS